jgi:uncharacterized damage-inducible protein DinB
MRSRHRNLPRLILRHAAIVPTVAAATTPVFAQTDIKAIGTEILLALLDHTTHHRASAEMYLRAKGITPTEYEF